MDFNWMTLILLLTPIYLFQLALAAWALLDLSRRRQVRGPRWLWAVALVITAFGIPAGIIASGLYLVWGRHAEQVDDLD